MLGQYVKLFIVALPPYLHSTGRIQRRETQKDIIHTLGINDYSYEYYCFHLALFSLLTNAQRLMKFSCPSRFLSFIASLEKRNL